MRSRKIRLTEHELMVAAYVGSARNVQSLLRNWTPGHQRGVDDTWTPNIEGVCGEIAVARWLNLYWEPKVGRPDEADVGPYEVRTNMSRRLTDLNLRPDDKIKDFRPFISVLSFCPVFEIQGWIYGRDGMIQENWRKATPTDPRPESWWVKSLMLNDLDTLPTLEFLGWTRTSS